MAAERQCYGGQWQIPITPYNRHLYWSPSWIEFDCGELAKVDDSGQLLTTHDLKGFYGVPKDSIVLTNEWW